MSRLERTLRVVCAYEACALWTRKVPTITSIVWSCRRRTFAAYLASLVAVLGGLAVVAWHLIWEGLRELDQ